MKQQSLKRGRGKCEELIPETSYKHTGSDGQVHVFYESDLQSQQRNLSPYHPWGERRLEESERLSSEDIKEGSNILVRRN